MKVTPSMGVPSASSLSPYANAYPTDQKPIAPPHASRRFFSMMLETFLDRTEPAQSMAKPHCMKKTKAPHTISHIVFNASVWLVAVSTAARARSLWVGVWGVGG